MRLRNTPGQAEPISKFAIFKRSIFLKICQPDHNFLTKIFTSKFLQNLAHFRFRLVFNISRYIIDQSELGIAQIEAYDQIKVLDFASLGFGSFEVILQKFSNLNKLHTIMKLLLPWLQKVVLGVIWGHLNPKWGYEGDFGVKLQKISNQDKLSTKMKLLIPRVRKSGFHGHKAPIWRYLGSFGVIWGHLTPKWGYKGIFGVKIQKFSNLDKLYTKMKLLVRWLRKSG